MLHKGIDMSDSEKTDELDNFGVWVKNEPDAASDEIDVTDSFLSGLDTDLSDISADAPAAEATESEAAETPWKNLSRR